MTKILIAGATGLVGSVALAQALADRRVDQVVAPTRRALPPHDKLVNPIVRIDALPVVADWWAVDGVICAIGTTRAKAPSRSEYRAIDFDYPLAIASLAREAGARAFALTSSAGADAGSPFFYTRIKGEIEAAMEAVGYPSLTFVRPGFLDGDRKETRPLERFVGAVLRAASPVLPASARVSPASTVAALLLEAAVTGLSGKHVISPAMVARASPLPAG